MSSKFSVLQTTPDENSNLLLKSKMSNNSNGSERKTLQTLQLSADGKLTGLQHPHSPGKKMVKKITASKKPLAVYTDKKALPVERGIQTDKQVEKEAGTQTEVSGTSGLVNPVSDSHNDSGVCPEDIDQEAYDLMVKEEVPESYWRDLAEERRLSLAEALSENELLHQSMEELKEENHNLSLVAGQAEYFANMLNSVLDDSKTEDKGEGDNSELSGDHSDAEEIKIEDKQSNLNEEQTVDQVEDTSKGDSNKKESSKDIAL